jgi:hypothetical protein
MLFIELQKASLMICGPKDNPFCEESDQGRRRKEIIKKVSMAIMICLSPYRVMR